MKASTRSSIAGSRNRCSRPCRRERSGVEERRKANTVDWLTYQLRVLGQGVQPSNWDRLGELTMPVLLIVGELDTKYVDIAHRMAATIADARASKSSRAPATHATSSNPT